jgi:hypothetical protein
MSDRDDFYIGYEPAMPLALRRIIAVMVASVITIAIAMAAFVVSMQTELADSRFEFGHVREFNGYLTMTPAPVLMVQDASGSAPHWLVAPGKHGAGGLIDGIGDGWVSLQGALIARESWRMIEVRPGSIQPVKSDRPPVQAAPTNTRNVVLRGEIVDSKCYLGVMNPGERAVHRDCAVRCLAGDVPPMFAFQDAGGSHLALLLMDDAAMRRSDVGRPITLTGVLSGMEDALVLTVAGTR